MKETLTYMFRSKRTLIPLLVLAVGCAVLVFLLRGARTGGMPETEPEPVTMERISLDRRGEELSLRDYRELRQQYPNASIRWDVPVGAGRYDSYSRTLKVPDYTAADREALDCFPRLKELDATGSMDMAALKMLAAEKPNFFVKWSVPLNGKNYSADLKEIDVDGRGPDAAELAAAIEGFIDPQVVRMQETSLTEDEMRELKKAFPLTVFSWPVEVCGRTFRSDAGTISFAGEEGLTPRSLREITEKQDLFYDLREVDLSGCGLSPETLCKLDEELGGTDVVWTMELYGVTVRSTDTEIDLSNNRYVKDNGAALEEVIPYMKHLEKAVLCEVEISNDRMVELYEKYLPLGVRIVWMVQIKWAGIRTDSTRFIPYPESGARQYKSMTGLNNLWYCPDLVALDLGHSNIKDLNYLSIMPNLKYLILADAWVTDLTEVGKLKNLTWLELFQTGVADISPLVGCTNLEHLNICYIVAKGDNVYETLRQMTWLKRIWCCGTFMTEEQIQSLREELPDCEIWSKPGDESTGSTWRFHDAYYEMRDAFHMYYMDINGNTVHERPSDEELAKIHKRYWGY